MKKIIYVILALAAVCALRQPAFSQEQNLQAAQAKLAAAPTEESELSKPEMKTVLAEEYPDLPPNHKPLGLGLSHAGDPYDIPGFTLEDVAQVLKGHGGSYYRAHIPIKEAMPVIDREHYRRLQLAVEDPQELDSLIEELAAGGKWERMDGMVNAITSQGINLVLVVGCGYQMEAPSMELENGKIRKVSPGRMGRELYATMTKWIVGAAVRRYASKVQVWQVENEINTAFAHTIAGWRVPDTGWIDKKYGIQMLKEFSEIVHKEGARQGFALKTTQNFATCWPGWQQYIKDSAQYLDIIGIDLYPNYFFGLPLQDKSADNVLKAKAVSGGKPVWVLEVGIGNGPNIRGFSPQGQAEFYRRIIDRCFRNGAEVVMVFGLFYNPAGWQTNGTGRPAQWFEPCATEAHWAATSKDPQTGEITTGPAWDAFANAVEKWFGS